MPKGRLRKFLEKPSWGEVFSDTINTGIYVIEPEILRYIPKNQNYDFAKDLFPRLMREGITLYGGSAQGYWRDVGNPESYRDVYEDILNDKVAFTFEGVQQEHSDGVLYSATPYELPASTTIVGKVILGKNVTLGEGVKLSNVVIGDDVSIGENSRIRNSVIWSDVTIGKGAQLDACVICDHNIIGKNVTVKSGLILAQGCEIGELVSVEKDVTIWPDKVIEDASIVGSSLILGSRYKNSIFEHGRVVGRSNVELSCEMATKLAEAFGAQLPLGSTIIMSRDYHKNSRMLKRAFLGGLLSAGINVIDYRDIPSSVLRHSLANNSRYDGGVYFNQQLDDPTSTSITFYNSDALRINNEISKKIEKAFFKEAFRRVAYSEIGEISEYEHDKEYALYNSSIKALLHAHDFKTSKCRIAVDMMHGTAFEIFPNLLNELGVHNIIFNAHPDEAKLSNMNSLVKRSTEDMSGVVKALGLDVGFMLYPYGQRLDIMSDTGLLLGKQGSLYLVLTLLNMQAKKEGTTKHVFLPTWAADIIYFDALEIKRGNYANFTKEQLCKYDLIATGEGNFTFREFATHRDSMYAALKVLGMILSLDVKISTLVEEMPHFYYNSTQIECAQSLKGKMMRMFLEDAKDKKSSTLDGVKIWLDEDEWILMIPDQYSDNLNIYIQAKDDARGEEILAHYSKKISEWSQM